MGAEDREEKQEVQSECVGGGSVGVEEAKKRRRVAFRFGGGDGE